MNFMQTSRSVVRYASANTVIVFHGNSLVLGQSGATDPMPAQVQLLQPVNNTVPCVNLGANGQNYVQMLTTGLTVDSYFDPTKKNILVVWEGHNTIHGLGYTPAQTFAALQTYCAARLAAHPGWIIVHMTCLPARYAGVDDADTNTFNANLSAFNALLIAGYKTTGAKALVDVRQVGSPFIMPDYSVASFNAVGLWSTGDGGQWVHLDNAGYSVLAQYVANVFVRLPAR